MRFCLVLILCISICSCQRLKNKELKQKAQVATQSHSDTAISYETFKKNIAGIRKQLAIQHGGLSDSIRTEIADLWVNAISNDLYSYWKNTPWDFNGITVKPGQGAIACGYFVTTILRDMDFYVNRVKLSTCASSQMMKSLVPGQPLKNLSYLSYESFNEKLSQLGKGVYIIGLDFHTGLIVNDGAENWFIHSNYIGRKGVTKEPVMASIALKASKTRWLISLTGDRDFLQKWLKG